MASGDASGPRQPRVLISYAHESPGHEDAVRQLWVFLRQNGIDARIDLTAAESRQDWTLWMQHQISEADHVLVVASAEYRKRADGLAAAGEGRGVQWEAAIIRDAVYRDRAAGLQRFLPVLLPGATVDDIPLFMNPTATTYYRVTAFTVAGAEQLMRVLTGQPFEVDIPLGPLPVLRPRSTEQGRPGPAQAVPVADEPAAEGRSLTLLHLSDLHFGKHHVFTGAGLTAAEQELDTLSASLRTDLDELRRTEGLAPDVVVVSGDLTESGVRREFEQAERFLTDLAAHLGLPRERVVIVPGEHDVNHLACEAYFMQCAADDTEPQPPYWRKWQDFTAMFERFYEKTPTVRFELERPYTLFEMPDLQLVVAGLNSTMAESHRDHYGWVGEAQLRWFADRLGQAAERGWLRLGVVHHNVRRAVRDDDESLRDADTLERVLAPELDLLLHGHTHDAGRAALANGRIVLSTGSAVWGRSRPRNVANQYQVLRFEPTLVRRLGRCYQRDQKRWVGDNRISDDGRDWRAAIPMTARVRKSAAQARRDERERMIEPAPGRRDDYLDRVAEITRLRFRGADVQRYSDGPVEYLRVSTSDDGMARLFPVGGCPGDVAREDLDRFVASAHDRYREVDPQVTSWLVYGGQPASADLIEAARRRGVLLTSFTEYQGLLDLRRYRERLLGRLLSDPMYPPGLYLPQRYSMLEGDRSVGESLLDETLRWLAVPQGRFVLVLGDFGMGKTFLLRELARRIHEHLPDMMPLLIELRTLQKTTSVDDLVGLHLMAAGEDPNRKAFRYMLREGRLVLLFDGFDELAFRVTYDRAAEHFDTILQALEGQAKVVVTSRSQHFISDEQVRTALGTRVEQIAGRRLVRIEPFGDEQVQDFLTRFFDGDRDRAARRFELIGGIQDLLGLSHNPRMLGFIAELDEEQLVAVERRHGSITSAELYRLLLTRWLEHETSRARLRGGAPSLSIEERWAAVTRLAIAMWQRGDRALALTDLTEASVEAIDRMAAHPLDPDEAAQAVGSGTMLVRDEDGSFAFVHQSVMEWLVANAAAADLTNGRRPSVLEHRVMSALMADFLRNLAGQKAATGWANTVLTESDLGGSAKRNALLMFQQTVEERSEPARLAGRDLRGADFSGQDLRGADLSGADLTDARLEGTVLVGARLTGAVAHRVRMNRADLRGADLTDADLTGGRLLGADLREATLHQTMLRRAALVGAQVGPDTLALADRFGAVLPDTENIALHLLHPAGSAEAVVFTAQGDLLAAAVGGAAVIYDAVTHEPLRVLRGHTSGVRSMAFSPDGRLLASAGADGSVRLWEAAIGRELHRLRCHTNAVWSVAFSPDGSLLASAGDDGSVRLWEVASGRELHRLEGHTNGVRSVAFSPDGSLLASAGDDGSVRLWDAASGREQRRRRSHTKGVRSVAFSPDGRLLALAGHDGSVRLWEAANGRELRRLEGHTDWVRSVAFSPDGRLLASAGADRSVRMWDAASGRELRRLEGHTNTVCGVAFSPDGRLLASAGADQSVRMWDAASGRELRRLEGHTNTVCGVAFSPHNSLLASAGADGSVRLWEAASGRQRHHLEGHTNTVMSVAFSPDGSLLASVSGDRSVRLWEAASARELRRLEGHRDRVMSVAFSPDGRLLASAGSDRSVRLWEPASGRELHRLEGHANAVMSVAFSPDGRLLASASVDGSLRLWEATSRRVLHRQEGHIGRVMSVAFSPDGSLLASAGDDRSVRLWEPASGRELRRLVGHASEVMSVAFSPDGRLLASAGIDRSVRLWESASGRELRRLEGHTEWVMGVAFSPDGRRLASAGDDGTVRLWEAATGEHVCTLVPLLDGWACLMPDGRYKVGGTPAGEFWYAAGLCRFEPGELDPYVPALKRLDPDVPLL